MSNVVRSTHDAGPLTSQEQALLDAAWIVHAHPRGDYDPVEATVHAYEALLDTALTTKAVAALLGVDTSRVLKRLRARTLYGLRRGHEWRLPAFQFHQGHEVTGLAQVLPTLAPNLHPVELATWLALPNHDLRVHGRELSPLDWLRSGGRPSAVVALGHDL